MSDRDFDEEKGFYSSFPMDLQKLKSFVVPVLNVRAIVEGKTSYIVEPLRRCTEEDFTSRGHIFKTEEDRI